MANGKNVRTAVKAAVLRQEIVKLSLAGWSNEDIATEKGISQATVNNHYHKFLESSKYPVADVEQVHVMRQAQRVQIEANQRLLVQHIDKLHNLVPADNREECEISAAICKCQDSYIRSSDHLASMFGMFAPKESNGSGSGSVTNNTQINMGESEFLRHLCNVKGIRLADG